MGSQLTTTRGQWHWVAALLAALLLPSPAPANAAATADRYGGPDYGYDAPVEATSPWPTMRHDRRNTGRSPIAARYRGDRPWAFRTGKGIFSPPIVGGDGAVYVGSADTTFYAVNPDGRRRWAFPTGGIIDSAAVIGRYDRRLRTSPITFGSGDENLYRLRSDRRRLSRKRRVIWRHRAEAAPATGQLVRWWEGQPVIGPGGTVYAGNTAGQAYAINPDGTTKWIYETGNSVWTAPAIADDGTTFWGSLDLFVHAVDANGQRRWRTPTAGFVTSSPALGRDGTLYIGSFDSKLYALDAGTGAIRWTFQTSDHIYSSPALAEDAQGNTRAIYIASTDGSIYAVRPSGALLWRYDTGDAIRSSPVLGRAPAGEEGEILYVGSSNGTLYAIDAESGTRRWSFDTTPRSPILRDRNDLNSSPALGKRGIYIGGEHGFLNYVPYDYCLHERGDRRCNSAPGEAFPDELTRVFPVTAGGNTEMGGLGRPLSAATILNGRLVVRRGGETVDASMQPLTSTEDLVTANPPFDFTAELSGDGHFVHIAPSGFLSPGTDYEVRVAGNYLAGGIPVGNTVIGGTQVGRFDDALRFRTASSRGPFPLSTSRTRVSALNLRRLAVPLPPFLPSVNQIGFDSYDLIVGTLARSAPNAQGEGSVLMWVIGARRGPGGVRVADPKSDFAFPLAGRYRDDFLILSQRDLRLTFSFGEVPIRRFELRAQLDRKLRALPGASLYGEVTCADVPNYGPALNVAGLCNAEGTLVASGTFITDAYDRRGAANRRPRALRVPTIQLERPDEVRDGSATATFALRGRARYPARRHVASILLTNADTGAVVGLEYRKLTAKKANRRGDLSRVRLTIPRGTDLPARVRAFVIADVFPLRSRVL